MFSRLFGSRKKEEEQESDSPLGDFSFLHTDMHSHMVPAIDDGAQTIEDSLDMISRFVAMGYSSIITTPHIKWDHYPNTTEIIQTGLAQLRVAMHEQGITIPIRAAAEYFIDDHFMELLEAGDLMTIHGKEVLVEFSFFSEPMNLAQILFQMQGRGWKPLLAHPERYEYLHRDMTNYNTFKDRGCLMQLNALSLTGYYGKGVKDAAEYMLKEGLYDYFGSDAHHIRHAEGMEKLRSLKVFADLMKYPFKNMDLN